MSIQQNIYRQRIQFSKVRSLVPIPNLIDIQKRSYDDLLQMNLLHSERTRKGLKAVFESLFPIHNGKKFDGSDATLSLECIDYTVGYWACKCKQLEGLKYLRTLCAKCSHNIITSHPKDLTVDCPKCGARNKNQAKICDECNEPVSLHKEMSIEECMERGATMSAPLKIRVRLNQFEKADKGVRKYKQSQESELYFGDVPIMTNRGTFVINGTERVVVSQLHRSPGVFFSLGQEKAVYTAQIIPYRGSWIEFELDLKGLIYVRIDKKRKFFASTFFRALGIFDNRLFDTQSILSNFYVPRRIILRNNHLYTIPSELLIGQKALEEIIHPDTQDTIIPRGKVISRSLFDKLLKADIKEVMVDRSLLDGSMLIEDVVNMRTGEVILEANNEFLQPYLEMFLANSVSSFAIFFPEYDAIGNVFSDTLIKDHTEDCEEAVKDVFRKIRPGEPATLDSGKKLLYSMFFDSQKYDLSRVGRHKVNAKLGINVDLNICTLTVDDLIATARYLLRLKKYETTRSERDDEIASVRQDDIDHLGNRRVRSVGELLENCFYAGLVRIQRAIKEKFTMTQGHNARLKPHDLISSRPVINAVRDFFSSSQLSQFMDQNNPLSEITHKRRLSALGPGGLNRDRAGFEVRDVHISHYGRICPIETPEGPNIGLISSLSCYARVNEFGFIESPYLKVRDGKIIDYVKIINVGNSSFGHLQVVYLDEVLAENCKLAKIGRRLAQYEAYAWYLSAWEEDEHIIAQAHVPVDNEGNILDEFVVARVSGETKMVERSKVTLMDVSPKQLVSVAAGLIPFLENDDANRALMGANMQRQAVPLIRTEAPIVGTGMEYYAARDSGICILCRRSGIVESVDAKRIVIRVEEEIGMEGAKSGLDIYTLVKYARSNQNTCLNQVPIVKQGSYVVAGQILADGSCCDNGELSLGRNLIVAYMPWRGYNFEDAILISERVVKEDIFTTIHIEEFETHARDTKLGPEDITRDIPQVRESMLRNLDESGIVRIGATVRHGDILVGKVTPKGETILSPEEKLLRAIFGEKASDVKDASLTIGPGMEGTVVDVKVFIRQGQDKDPRTQQIEQDHIQKLENNLADECTIIRAEARKKMIDILNDKCLSKALLNDKGEKILNARTILSKSILNTLSYHQFKNIKLKPATDSAGVQVTSLLKKTDNQLKVLRGILNQRIERLIKGDELLPGVLKTVKCYVAIKRKLQVGDKMAGRHGNKGVVSCILPVEDMPYLEDGTPVDIVLNPLGVPSRMNIGQILECHLGWAGKILGLHFNTPVFEGAKEQNIKKWLHEAWLTNNRVGPDITGKCILYDGMTGEAYEQPVTVGCVYMMKLHHLVDNKIHARSIGPYSLVTQQPLGGKSQFGGQRFGEMEVWALEAYGAAHILQELLTYKSDDIYGRTQVYQSIIKGAPIREPGLPESFNVVRRELSALCIDMTMLTREELETLCCVDELEFSDDDDDDDDEYDD